MSQNNTNDTNKLPPFPQFCYTIGMLPTSYKTSLTYEEQLLWLCDYMKNTVIPTVNNNGMAVDELQKLYIELRQYVDTYFDSLNVQTEINNKLDKMASDGTLAKIINTDIFNELNNEINTINSEATIFVGDSYAGYGYVTNLCQLLNLTLNTNAWNFSVGGAGFAREGNTFLGNLQARENVITDKSQIKRIVVCGGYNDRMNTDAAIIAGIENFCNHCRAVYPNARIYIGMIGGDASFNDTQGTITTMRLNLLNVLKCYKLCGQFGATYLNGVEYIMINRNYFQSDNVHPNTTGTNNLTIGIYQALMSGSFSFNLNEASFNAGYLTTIFRILDNKMTITFLINNKDVSMNISPGNSYQYITLASSTDVNNTYLKYVNAQSTISLYAFCTDAEGKVHILPARFRVLNDKNGSIQIGYINNENAIINVRKIYLSQTFVLEPKLMC